MQIDLAEYFPSTKKVQTFLQYRYFQHCIVRAKILFSKNFCQFGLKNHFELQRALVSHFQPFVSTLFRHLKINLHIGKVIFDTTYAYRLKPTVFRKRTNSAMSLCQPADNSVENTKIPSHNKKKQYIHIFEKRLSKITPLSHLNSTTSCFHEIFSK